jgi:hypothetical protein
MDPVLDAHGNNCPVKGQSNLGLPDFVPGRSPHGLRGTPSVEIYDNTLITQDANRFIAIRGGTGVVFNNTMTTKRKGLGIHFYEEESYLQDTFDVAGRHYPAWDGINNFYVWNNTLNGKPTQVYLWVGSEGQRYYIQENRDYFNRAPDRETDVHYGYKPFTYPHPMTNMDGKEATP